jgi:hypothetical protein
MKKIYLLLPATLLLFAANAQFRIGTVYSLSIPQKEMADNIKPAHGLNISLLYMLHGICNRISIGTEIGIANYAHITKEQELNMADGSTATTDVVYSSNIVNAAFSVRGNILEKGKIIPYLNIKAGYTSFFSDVYVEDPASETGCKALERKNIISDNTFFWAYGGGLQFDLNWFAKKVEQGKYQIDVAVNKINGGNLDYINTKKIQSHEQIDANASEKGEPFTVSFININTQTIHEHQVAELYNSPLHMLDIRIGMLFKLGK